jgi:hypothetical protein
MYTKSEIKSLPKGFMPSKTNNLGNRKTRRADNSKYGIHNPNNGAKLLVRPTGKFWLWVQYIFEEKTGKFKKVVHSTERRPT